MTDTVYAQRLAQLRKQMDRVGADAFVTQTASNRRYLTGFTGSYGVVIVGAGGENRLLTDLRYIEQAGFEAPDFPVVPYKNDWSILRDQIEELGVEAVAFEALHTTVSWLKTAQEQVPTVDWVPTEQVVELMRARKHPSELELIRRAQALTDAVFTDLTEMLQPGITEKQLAVEFKCEMLRRGADDLAFDPIVVSGPRTSLQHGKPSDRQLAAGDFVLFDIGAMVNGYRSDMTRTLMLGQPDEQQVAVYEAVLKAERAGVAAVAPGASAEAPYYAAYDILAETEFSPWSFQVSVGHGVGLDIHEEPFLRDHTELRLEPGMVITVEPGVYIPDWGGVRIEDLVLVTENGHEILSRFPTEMVRLKV